MTGVRAVSGKAGVLACFFNQIWVNPHNVTVKERVCCPHIGLLSVGFRAFYEPREFPYTVVIVVYIPPRAAPTTVRDVIHDAVPRIQTQHPEAFIAIKGDFNHVSLSSYLTGFVQYVNCPTRGERTLDMFYANMKEAYRAVSLPPLGRSDHSMVYLQPTYLVYKDFLLLPDLSGSGHQRQVMH